MEVIKVKLKRKGYISSVIYYSFVVIFSFLMLYPILWMFGSSLKPETEIFSNVLSLLPIELNWLNYPKGWEGFGGIGFAVFFKNSLFVTVMVVIGSILSSSIVAYGFARMNFRYKKIDRKSTRLNSSHVAISYAVFCLKKK